MKITDLVQVPNSTSESTKAQRDYRSIARGHEANRLQAEAGLRLPPEPRAPWQLLPHTQERHTGFKQNSEETSAGTLP